jgi:hypothetical protein
MAEYPQFAVGGPRDAGEQVDDRGARARLGDDSEYWPARRGRADAEARCPDRPAAAAPEPDPGRDDRIDRGERMSRRPPARGGGSPARRR